LIIQPPEPKFRISAAGTEMFWRSYTGRPSNALALPEIALGLYFLAWSIVTVARAGRYASLTLLSSP